MAKILDLQSFKKGKSGQPPAKDDPDSLDFEVTDGKHLRAINVAKEVSGLWPKSHISFNAGAGFLLAVGVLCGLYLGRNETKSPVTNPKPEEQLQSRAAPLPPLPAQQATPQPPLPAQQTTPQQPAPARHLSKPSPITPANTARPENSVVSRVAPSIVPTLPTSSIPRYTPVRYEATHKKMFGGCTGQLELTSSGLHFSCPDQDLNLPVGTIARTHKDGVVLKSGEKYHFTIANHSKDQVEAIFISWLNTVQEFPQVSRASF